MQMRKVHVRALAILLAFLALCMGSVQADADPFASLFDAERSVRLQAWTEILKLPSLTAVQADALLAGIAEYQSAIPQEYLRPTDGVALSIDLLGRFRITAAIPELMRVKSFAVFETALCAAARDEIRTFADDFAAAMALIAIGSPCLSAVESELSSGAPTDLDAQLDGLIHSWIAGREETLTFLESSRRTAGEDASQRCDLARDVVEKYNDTWCFDGSELVPPGVPITPEEILKEYQEERDKT